MSLNKLHPGLQAYVINKNWKDLTDIQKAAFDPIFEGASCTIEAPTSGGKTEAVLFPLLTRLAGKKTPGFKVLFIAPLKALLNDLADRVLPLAEKCYLEAFKWHGDVSQDDKIQQMRFPSDILLTTPESLEAILLRRANKEEVFKNLETIVIDEAHYFALTERGSHLVAILERLGVYVQKPPQRIAVTATIGNPEGLLEWLLGDKTNGMCISVKAREAKEKDFKIQYFMEDGVGFKDSLYTLLQRKKSIVFERSRTSTEETAGRINELNLITQSSFPVKVKTHHSSVSKHFRETAEKAIKKDAVEALNAIISTSTLELGIDIGELDQVIQVGGLASAGSFLQRVGRTGRRPGRPQVFRGLCFEEEDLILLTGCISLGLKHRSEAVLFPRRAFHILAHQVICVCLQYLGATKKQIWNLLSKAYCFSAITEAEFDLLIKYMLEEDYLRVVNEHILLVGEKCETSFLRANWKRLFAIFDTEQMYNVVEGRRVIGTLDSGFAGSQQMPFVFVLGGQEWNALKIDHEQQQILVQKNETGIAPKWTTSSNYDVPFELAQEIGAILSGSESLEFLDPLAQRVIHAQRSFYESLNWKPGTWSIEHDIDLDKIILWTFAGSKINRALGAVLSKSFKDVKHDYKNLSIDLKIEPSIAIEKLYEILIDLKYMREEDIIGIIENEVVVKWFSKFSLCLPDKLARRTLIEKRMDFTGVLRELNKVELLY
jgi:ATP-dependent helicase Lhr and Lhr-like helicase